MLAKKRKREAETEEEKICQKQKNKLAKTLASDVPYGG